MNQRSPRTLLLLAALAAPALGATTDDFVFIHHSCGRNWLDSGLHAALLAKSYIDERNDVTYGTDMPPDPGRPDSLASVPGDRTDMRHWVPWFNDYLNRLKTHACASGQNRIIMFKSCYPASDVTSDGVEPGNPFSSAKTLTNYKAVFRHPTGSGNTYAHPNGNTYRALGDVFADHPDTLFIFVTAPPLCYGSTTDANGHRARLFNNWVKGEWLDSYRTEHGGLRNVVVFDWFDLLAYPDDHATHPNRLREEYGGSSGNSHPNAAANAATNQVFATDPDNFIDDAWFDFNAPPALCVDDSNASGIQDGSAAHPYLTIQQAVHAVADRGTVRVAAGTYVEAVVVSGKEVRLLGGYPGSTNYLTTPGDFDDAARDWLTHLTTIDGAFAHRCLLFDDAGGELSGFHVLNGRAYGDYPLDRGGGVACFAASITIADCHIASNAAYRGGGIYAGQCSPTIQGCVITANTSDNEGAGILCVEASPVVTRNHIGANYAVGCG